MKIIIIGGVAGGMSAATRLRRLQEDAEIIVLERGPHVSYANCGLPYFVSGKIAKREALLLQTPEALYKRFRIDVRVNTEAVSIDPAKKIVSWHNPVTGAEGTENYDALILSMGAEALLPDVPGAENARTLRDVVDADALKAAVDAAGGAPAVVLGAGFVGLEVAENLRELGLPVTVVQRNEQILTPMDAELAVLVHQELVKNGVDIILGAEAARITENSVELTDGRSIPAAVVLSSIGVSPDIRIAQEAGLAIGPRGGISVDEQQRTSDASIYAIGDAVEKHNRAGDAVLIPLANLANRHGRLVADVIAGREARAQKSTGTAIIGLFDIAAAMTGASEKQLVAAGREHKVIHLHPASHAGYYPGAKPISLKVMFEPATGLILGAQAVGADGVDKRIDVIATAMAGGLTIDDLMDLELAYAPQFGSAKDAINQTGYVGSNVFHGDTPTVQWHELDARLGPEVTLIDVRDPHENEAGSIPGAVNIPVNQLRERMAEVGDGQVIVYCQVGQRGHTATQILRGHGKQVWNLDGGYKTWRAGMDARSLV